MIDSVGSFIPLSETVPKVSYTIENETREIVAVVYENGKRIKSDEWDLDLLIETGSDMLSLTSPAFKDKKVLIVKLQEWKRGKLVEQPIALRCYLCGKMTCKGECDEDTFLGLI